MIIAKEHIIMLMENDMICLLCAVNLIKISVLYKLFDVINETTSSVTSNETIFLKLN